MSRYDGLIIPRSYSEYINKTDAATLQQALQLSGVLSGAVAAGDNKAVTSNAVNNALIDYINKTDAATLQQALQLPGVLSGAVAAGDNKAVTSNAVNNALVDYQTAKSNILTSSVDLNTLNTAGRYFPTTDAVGNGCSNKPIEVPFCFYLEVLKTPNGTTYQIMYTAQGTKYVRMSYDSGVTWGSWT